MEKPKKLVFISLFLDFKRSRPDLPYGTFEKWKEPRAIKLDLFSRHSFFRPKKLVVRFFVCENRGVPKA